MKVTSDQIVLRLSGADFIRRRAFDKRAYHTFARADASTCATYRNRMPNALTTPANTPGMLSLAPAGKLRVDWDEVLGIPGILIEGPRQNKIQNGNYEVDIVGTFANVSTIIRDSTGGNPSPRLGGFAVKVTTTNVGGSGLYWQNRDASRMAAAAARLYTVTVDLYAPSASAGKTFNLSIEWYLSGGGANGAASSPNIVLVAGWQRLTFTASSPASTAFAVPTFYTNGAQGIFDFWADPVQFEEGAFGSSPIATGTVAVDRAADILDCRMGLDMARDWSLYLYFKQMGSHLTSWPDTEPQTDPYMVSLHPDVAGTYTDNGGSLLCHRQNAAAQYEWEYNQNRGTAARTFATTVNAQKLMLRHHALDHHLSAAIDGGAFVDGAAPSGVSIAPMQLLRLGQNVSAGAPAGGPFARYFNLLLAYELHTQAEMEVLA